MRYALTGALLAACATTPTTPPASPGSRGLRASEHLDAAREHDQLATQRASWAETRPDANGRIDQPMIAMPWRSQWDSPEQHEQLAAAHRAAAAQQHADYERLCGDRPLAEVSQSPIARYGIGGVPTETGVVVILSAGAGPANHLLADIECHRAWMMLAPSDMDACPLDLAGIHVDAIGDEAGITLTITERDLSLIPELQRRVARDLEHKTSR